MKLLLLLLASLKFGKLLTTGGTMLLSMVVYGWVFGWPYAVGFVLLLLVHELGHYVAARQRGMEVGAPTFIPFVGAWIAMAEQPRDAETEAYIGLAGPLVGTLGAMACYLWWRHSGDQLFLALTYVGCMLNLFNLIPLSPFDGGRICAVLSPRLWLLGVPMLVALFFYRPSPLLILMALLAAPQVMKALKPLPEEERQYYVANAETRFTYAVCYLGLAAFLAVMSHDLHLLLPRG